MDAVFLELFNRSIAAGWLVLAVVLLRLALKKAPKNLHCLLWGLVALRLLLPARLESPLSLIPSAQTIRPEALLSETPTVQTGFAAVDQVVNPVFAGSFAPAVGASVNPLQVWTRIGALLWLCGFAVMLLYTLISYLRLRRRVADSLPLRDNIRLSEHIASPFVLGILRPKIYLPLGLSEETTAMVLAHEQGHIARHDHWFKPFAFLLLSLCWFHPLAWLAYALYCRDIELACDEHVLRAWGNEVKKAYSSALLDCSVSARSIAACPLAFGETGVKTRIRSVLSYRKPGFWILFAAGLSVTALCICFLTDPVEAAQAEPVSPFAVETEVMRDTLSRMELGGYEAISREDYAARWGQLPLLTLPELPGHFEAEGELYAMDASGAPGIGPARFAQLWFSPATGEALFASWLENPGRVDEPMSMAHWQLISTGGTGWANFLAESRGKVGDTDVVLRYYAADPDTDPEALRALMETVELTAGPQAAALYLVGVDDSAGSIEAAVRTWQAAYEAGWRDLFIEFPYYTGQYLNRWLRGEDEAILAQLYADLDGTAAHIPAFLDAFTALRDACPETVIHGVDVGHQFSSTGLRYQGLLRGEGQMGSEDYARTLEALDQGHAFYRERDYAYREQTMAANLMRDFEALNGRPALGVFVSPHLAEGAMDDLGTPGLLSLLAPLGDAVQVIAPVEADPDARLQAERAALTAALTETEASVVPPTYWHDAAQDVSLTLQVGMTAPIRPILGLEDAPLASVGLDVYDAGYLHLFDGDDGEPMLLAIAPTEGPVPVEVRSGIHLYTLLVTVIPGEPGQSYYLYETPDPAEVDTLEILFNDRPLHEYTTSTSGMYYVLYTQATPGGRVKAEWTSSDESVARVTVRADGACVLETLRASAEPVTITASYGAHQAELTLHVG